MAATYTKPTKIPRWADTGTIVEPAEAKKDSGWVTTEKPPASYFNWLENLSGQWFKWLDERLFDGATKDELFLRYPGNGTTALKITLDGVSTVKSFGVGLVPTASADPELQIVDAEFKLHIPTGLLPTLQFESTGGLSSIEFDRTTNRFGFYIAGVLAARLAGNDLSVAGGLFVGSTTAPAADDAIFIGDADFSLDFNGGNPSFFADTDSVLRYDRAGQSWEFDVNGTELLAIKDNGLGRTVLRFATGDELRFDPADNLWDFLVASAMIMEINGANAMLDINTPLAGKRGLMLRGSATHAALTLVGQAAKPSTSSVGDFFMNSTRGQWFVKGPAIWETPVMMVDWLSAPNVVTGVGAGPFSLRNYIRSAGYSANTILRFRIAGTAYRTGTAENININLKLEGTTVIFVTFAPDLSTGSPSTDDQWWIDATFSFPAAGTSVAVQWYARGNWSEAAGTASAAADIVSIGEITGVNINANQMDWAVDFDSPSASKTVTLSHFSVEQMGQTN